MNFVPKRLYAQIVLLKAVILIATFVAYGWLTNTRQAAMLQKAMETDAAAMAESFAESCAHFLVLADYAGLENFVLRSANLPHIDRLQVCERNGTVLVDVQHPAGARPVVIYGSPPLVVPVQPPESDPTITTVLSSQIVVWHPVQAGTVLGWTRSVYNMSEITELQATVWQGTLALGVLFMAGGFFLFLIVLRPTLTAISRLSAFARNLNELKGQRIEVPRSSLEIETLAESLNSASRELLSTEQQLIAERERLSVTLQSIGDGVIATDTHRKIILMNRVAEQLTGWSEQEARGARLDEVFRISRGRTGTAVQDLAEQVTLSRMPVTLDEHSALLQRDGAERIVAASAAPIVSAAGSIVGVVLVFRDETDKEKMRAERAKLESQLRQSQKMEAVGQLAGGIAHDFNNILSAIIGYASLLQMKTRPDDPLRSNIDPILDAADRAATLTRSLLAFSRKQVVDMKPIDINSVINGIQKILKRLIQENVEFVVDLHESELTVIADAGQVEQVLMNLVTNARDAMPEGGRLMISTGRCEFERDEGEIKSGSYALLTVSDTGTGMDRKTLEHIFEPFFTTKEVGKGTGLGLSMVYGIVKQCGGAIHVYSEPGMGTTFRIYLPLSETGPRPSGRRRDMAEETGSETILLVEDDTSVREITRIMLEEHGYRVLEAADGETALSVFRQYGSEIQMVLTDVIMPVMDGRKLAEKLQTLRPDIRVLFMSGYTADLISSKGILEQGMHYITKPLNPADFLRKVREVLAS